MGALSIGTVELGFKCSQSGRVSQLHLIKITSANESFVNCCKQAIMDAKLPPMTPDVTRDIKDGTLVIECSFTIYE